MQVGFIGVGAMGASIARRLINHGHDVGVFARRAGALGPLVDAGAREHPSPAAVAEHSEILFTMVTATSDVEQVLFGSAGVSAGGRDGLLVVDMSTIDPSAARAFPNRLAAKGIDVLDAPVSGGPEGAEQGTLTVMCGGPADLFERARPLFECFGSTILHMGPHGTGQSTKACHQLLLLVTAEGVAEALTLARRSGVDPVRAREAMMAGIASSRVLDRFGARMADRQFEAGIAARLYRKDIGIVFHAARTLGVDLPAGQVVRSHIDRLFDRGLAESDLSALITVVESAAKPEGA
jgi:3-hydroxyisobutyrate dehydrogenase-like beta-hydroxyacid dehydrogenase